MPTYKHPCPYCDKFIDRAVAACPYCGQVDPFSPKRCPNCSKIIEDPAWITCPSCGQSLVAPPPGATAAGGAVRTAATGEAPASTPAAPPAAASAAAAPGSTATQPAPPSRPPLNPDAAAPVLQSQGACSGCGAPLPAGAHFCTICGTVVAG